MTSFCVFDSSNFNANFLCCVFRKLFVGGLSWDTSQGNFLRRAYFIFECVALVVRYRDISPIFYVFIYYFTETLQRYFSRYGEVIDCVVMKNSESGRSRGFGFVTFADPSNVNIVLQNGPHQLDGRTVCSKYLRLNLRIQY